MRKLIESLKKFFKNKKNVYALIVEILLLWGAIVIFRVTAASNVRADYEEVLWNDFIEMAKDGEIDTVYYDGDNSEYLEFTLLNDETKNMSRKERALYEYPEESWRKTLNPKTKDVGGLRDTLLRLGVNMRYKAEQEVLDALTGLAGLIVPIFFLVMLIKLLMGQTRGFAPRDVMRSSSVRFADVIGHEEVLDDLRFITKLIKDPSLGESLGVKIPKGVLLSGPPGTGKTMLAKAVAGESGVPFISVSGSDFKELYVGMGAKKVRQLFKIARDNAPCILFIDEIDAVGAARDTRQFSTSEDTQTINALLKEMDGFTSRDGVFLFAATNHPEKLDKALKRSGRFDREITINAPRTWKVRKALLDHYLKDKAVSDDVCTESLARQLVGFTGADMAMICNEAGIVAMMHDKKFIDMECLEEAVDRKVFNGSRSKAGHYEEDKKVIAYHEAGHAVVTYLCGEPISRASIIGTTSGVGGAVFGEDAQTLLTSKTQLENKIMICFGGRASEQIKFNSITTGASNDIDQATGLLKAYYFKYGFSDDFGLLNVLSLVQDFGPDSGSPTPIERLSDASKCFYAKTLKLLSEDNHYDLVEKLATKLLECETLSGKEIDALLSGDSESDDTESALAVPDAKKEDDTDAES